MFEEGVDLIRCCAGKDEDGQSGQAAKPGSFLFRCDAKCVDLLALNRCLCDNIEAMTVGIRLHDRHNASSRADLPAYEPQVAQKMLNVNFGAGGPHGN